MLLTTIATNEQGMPKYGNLYSVRLVPMMIEKLLPAGRQGS
jgi:hypothetical protein